MAQFKKIALLTALPAANVTPADAMAVENVNSLSVRGLVTVGKGNIYLLRRIQTGPSTYQFFPWLEDRPAAADAANSVGGNFSGRFVLPQNCGPEQLALYDPTGLTFSGDVIAAGETL